MGNCSSCSSNSSSTPIKLGYWDFRYQVQVSRFLLEYTQQSYDDRVYKQGSQVSEWSQDRRSFSELGFCFPSLPYLVDGDFILSNRSAIEQYIIKRCPNAQIVQQLLGSTPQEQANIKMLAGVLSDVTSEIEKLVLNQQFYDLKKKVWSDTLKPTFEALHWMVMNKKFLMGVEVSYVDFLLYEILLYVRGIWTDDYNKLPQFSLYCQNFERLPNIKEYISSFKYQSTGAFFPPALARWSGNIVGGQPPTNSTMQPQPQQLQSVQQQQQPQYQSQFMQKGQNQDQSQFSFMQNQPQFPPVQSGQFNSQSNNQYNNNSVGANNVQQQSQWNSSSPQKNQQLQQQQQQIQTNCQQAIIPSMTVNFTSSRLMNTSSPQKGKLQLGYWAIRFRAQVARFLLEYTGTEYEEKLYTNAQEWFGKDAPEMKKLGFNFPNLPYLRELSTVANTNSNTNVQSGNGIGSNIGSSNNALLNFNNSINNQSSNNSLGFCISESQAIEEYIIRRANRNELFGRTPEQSAKVKMYLGVINDFRDTVFQFVTSEQFEQNKNKFFNEQILGLLDILQQEIGMKKFLVMDQEVSYADFALYEVLQYVKGIYPNSLLNYKGIQAFLFNFEQIEQIAQYINSKRYLKAPFFPPDRAKWTGL